MIKLMPQITCKAAMYACKAPSGLQKVRPVAVAATIVEPVAQSGGVSDKINYNAAISAKSGRWQLELNLLNPTTAARLVPNEMAYNAAISAWEKAAKGSWHWICCTQ